MNMTIKELLLEGRGRLNHSTSAALDCELLLAHALEVEVTDLIGNSESEVEENREILFRSYLERAANGEPVAYILNKKEFFGLDFFVDNRVLIPRPETEHLVEEVIGLIPGLYEEYGLLKLLDVGTGSCNIPVSIVNHFFSRDENFIESFDVIDVSRDALDVARLNIEKYGLEGVIFPLESDLLSEIDDGERFDVIVANLPYIGTEKFNFVTKSAKDFEPNLALFGGSDGLVLYKKLFQQLLDKEINFRFLLGEYGFAQSEELKPLLTTFFDQNWEIKKDLAGIDRYFVVKV